MTFLEGIPIWMMAGFIFSFRILDVSLGTIRTISVVNGRVRLSFFLGFVEILVWVTVVSQVVLRMGEHPVLGVAYAAGFASGNAVGIYLERKLALGQCVIRIISSRGDAIAQALESLAHVLASFRADQIDGRRSLVFATLARGDLPAVLEIARELDPDLFYVVERFSETSHLSPLPHATGWRAVFKKK